jgi:hypothetical protein
MSHYRIYFLDGRNLITGVEEADFETDEQALERARALLEQHRGVELWTGTRWVDHLLKRAA